MGLGKKILVWIAISLCLQLSVLSYVNFIFLGDSLPVIGQASEEYKSAAYKLPEDASDIKVSYDATYVSYIHDGKLNFVNIKRKKQMYAMAVNSYEVAFHRWLPDRNIAIVALKTVKGNYSDFKLYTYDCDTNSEKEVQEITQLKKGSMIENIQLSTLTNAIYISIRSDSLPALFRINIMGDKRRVYPRISDYANLKQLNLKDTILYEDPKTGKIYVQEGSEAWSIPINGKLKLLNIDKDDNVYIAEEKNGIISSITYGKLTVQTKNWRKINLGEAIKAEDILVGNGGEVFIKDEANGYLTKVSDGSKIVYDGKFIEAHDDFIVSFYRNQIKVIPVNT